MCSVLSAAVSRVDTTPSSMAKSCRNVDKSHMYTTQNMYDPGIPILQGSASDVQACVEPQRGEEDWELISPGPQ